MSDPVQSRPPAAKLPAIASPSTRLAPTPSSSVADNPVVARMGAARINSTRPRSSSARVCRTTKKVLMSPASTARYVKTWKYTYDPRLEPSGRPRSAMSDGVATASFSTCARDSSVGNSTATPAALAYAMSAVAAIQIGSVTRSRRNCMSAMRIISALSRWGHESRSA